MEILAEDAVSGDKTAFVGISLDRPCQGYGGPRDNAFQLAYRLSAFVLYLFAALGDQQIACFLAE
jgi:hypothetical protein